MSTTRRRHIRFEPEVDQRLRQRSKSEGIKITPLVNALVDFALEQSSRRGEEAQIQALVKGQRQIRRDIDVTFEVMYAALQMVLSRLPLPEIGRDRIEANLKADSARIEHAVVGRLSEGRGALDILCKAIREAGGKSLPSTPTNDDNPSQIRGKR